MTATDELLEIFEELTAMRQRVCGLIGHEQRYGQKGQYPPESVYGDFYKFTCERCGDYVDLPYEFLTEQQKAEVAEKEKTDV